MDIVELEMRARLIQTMLKKDPKNSNGVPDIKPEPVSDHSSRRSYSRSSRSYSRSTSRSYSRSRSRTRSGSYSYSDDEKSRRKKHGDRRSLKSRHSRRHRKRSSSAQRDTSKAKSDQDTNKKTPPKKTKISRKEFEDRMKKAKENRTYRSRRDSEEEEKKLLEEDAKAREQQKKHKEPKKMPPESAEEGEAGSEKEEGEIDSNEEGNGNSDRGRRSSLSDHSSSKSGGRRKSHRRKKKSKKESRKPVDKNLIQATLNRETSSAFESNPSNKKTGMEAVDSEEDFDSPHTGALRSVKIEQSSNLVLRTDRTNVSFSFNKKLQPSLTQGTDLEFGRSSARTALPYKQLPAKDQIVISSDSDNEGRRRKKTVNSDADNDVGLLDAPMEIEDDNVPEKDTDQSDLRLCEETVMKDIFADIDEETEEMGQSTDASQTHVKEEPQDIEGETVPEVITSKKSKSRKNKKKRCDKALETRQVKQELLSPCHNESTDLNLNEVFADSRRTKMGCIEMSESRRTSEAAAKFSNETDHEMRSRPCSERGLQSPIKSRLLQEVSNDSEEGACSDQEHNLSESCVQEETSTSLRDSSPTRHHAAENVQQSKVQNFTEEPDKETSEGEASESEDGGLVDLPEEEQFEVEDDDDADQVSKYQEELNICAQLEEDREASVNTDFYRGAEEFNFSKENSQSDMAGEGADDQANLNSRLIQPPETMEDGDAVLVELHPDEAEELTAVDDFVLPVRKQGNTEIIGEIEPSSDSQSGLQNITDNGSSWSTRWLQSEKVQKVVTSSKMLSRMRKRIKTDKINAKSSAAAAAAAAAAGSTSTTASPVPAATEATSTDNRSGGDSETVPVIGSMEEYQRVIAGQDGTSQDATAVNLPPGARTSSHTKEDSSEDSEEDELWSKMLGN